MEIINGRMAMLTELGKELRKIRINSDEILKDMASKLGITQAYGSTSWWKVGKAAKTLAKKTSSAKAKSNAGKHWQIIRQQSINGGELQWKINM